MSDFRISVLGGINNKTIEDMARIHSDSLPDDYIAKLGFAVLCEYYDHLLRMDAVNAYILRVEHETAGYVVYSDESVLPGFVKKNAWIVAYNILLNCRSIKFIQHTLDVVWHMVTFRHDYPGVELCYIAIDEKYTNLGAGSKMLNVSFKALAEKGIRSVWLKTLLSTPENIEFYTKNLFSVSKIHRGRVYMTRVIR